jgi:hypothetical protein
MVNTKERKKLLGPAVSNKKRENVHSGGGGGGYGAGGGGYEGAAMAPMAMNGMGAMGYGMAAPYGMSGARPTSVALKIPFEYHFDCICCPKRSM